MTSDSATASGLNVVVVGLGYIGLPTAAVVARAGMSVLGVDVNPQVVETVASGNIHIEEKDLDAIVHAMVSEGRLRASTTPEIADTFVIAVPTPFGPGNVPDTSYVLSAAETIAPVLKPGDLVILESTSPVGTTEAMRETIARLRPDLAMPGEANAIAICYCPERVLPGRILAELVENSRCIGGLTPACAARARAFYERFVEGECVVTDARTAEMVKLVENSSRDVAIAFANELSLVCDTLALDVWEVIQIANRHPRVNILQPGPGVGGHCIAVDPWFLVHSDPANTPLIRTARQVNDNKTDYIVARIAALLDARPDARLAAFGLSFKADTDDLRESPAVRIAQTLAHSYPGRVDVVEPHVQTLPDALAATGAALVGIDEALDRCDIAALLVDHREFAGIASDRLAQKHVVDTRGQWRSRLNR